MSRLPERLTDGATIAFGIWTLLANATVLSGGTLDHLLIATAATATLAVPLALRHRSEPPLPVPDGPDRRLLPLQLLLLPAATLLAHSLVPGRVEDLWKAAAPTLLTLLLLDLALLPRPSPSPSPSPSNSSSSSSSSLLLLSLLSLSLTLSLHRPAADEAFYVNLAVSAADSPHLPLLARDTLHGLPEPYPVMPIYRIQSFELLTGALARLTGLEALTLAQLFVPALAALLLPLALARLFRLLAPRRWLACVAVVLLVYTTVGDTPRGYGNFGFARLFMGKSVFCSLGVPLIAAYAIEYARAPAGHLRRPWLLLFLAQVSAVGLTSSALWIAPTVAGLALLSAIDPRPRGLARGLLGLTASAWPIAAGLWLTTELESAVLALGARVRPARLFASAFEQVLGEGPIAVLFAAAMVGAWGAAPTALARRFALLFPLGFLLAFWNPHLAPWVAETVTGNATYWRVFWLLPLPVLVALVLTLPLELRGTTRLRGLGALATVGLASLLVLAPGTPLVSPDNGTRLAWPEIKIPPAELDAARAVVAAAGPGQRVLAPMEISQWIPTLRHHPWPLVVREAYIDAQRGQLGRREVNRRKLLTLNAGGTPPGALARALSGAVADYELAALCLASRAADPATRASLERLGFDEVWSSEAYAVFARPISPP